MTKKNEWSEACKDEGGQPMKKLYTALNIMMWSFIGVFIGGSLYKWYDYKMHPDLYAMQSAPWYLGLATGAVITMAAVTILLIVMGLIRKRMKK